MIPKTFIELPMVTITEDEKTSKPIRLHPFSIEAYFDYSGRRATTGTMVIQIDCCKVITKSGQEFDIDMTAEELDNEINSFLGPE